MKPATACLAAALLVAGCARHVATPSAEEEAVSGMPVDAPNGEQEVLSLVMWTDFRSDPYIREAIRLQGMGREAATKALRKLALQERASGGLKVFVLCRMLFAKSAGGEFRPPALEGVVCLGDTGCSDWPLAPVEVVDGVPFLIAEGYSLEGEAEPGESYLAYCLATCDWSGFRYAPKTAAEKSKALEKLLSSARWKELPGKYERSFLAEQVE